MIHAKFFPRQETPRKSIETDDSVLFDRAKKGDREAFGKIFRRYREPLISYLLQSRLCKSKADAEDVAQQTFAKALEAIGNFEWRASPKFWLFSIARHAAIDRLRQITPQYGEETLASISLSSSQEEAIDWLRFGDRLDRALEKLDGRSRAVFAMAVFEGKSGQEIGQHFDIPESNVKTILHRARGRLADELAEFREAA